MQECQAGLITVRQTKAGLAFAAPPLVRSGPVEEPTAERVAQALDIGRDDIVDIAWADNGPGWVAVLLASAEAVLALRPGTVDMDIGVAGPTRTVRRPPWRCGLSARRSPRSRTRSRAA